MISQLRGTIVALTPTELVLDVSGVGYRIHIPLSTFERFEHASGEITVLTHYHVREDSHQLYGFATETERALFRNLISISGIGPKIGQSILSGLNVAELQQAIALGNVAALTGIAGVGKKTAERIVLELRNKIAPSEAPPVAAVPSSAALKIRSEAIIALMSLGHTRADAERALRSALQELQGEQPSVEQLVRRALRRASS